MSKSQQQLPKTGRNAAAVAAHFRSAGSMKDKRLPRGGARNYNQEFFEEYEESLLIEAEVDNLDEKS